MKRWKLVSVITLSVVILLGTSLWIQRDQIISSLLLPSLQQDISLPKAFWKSINFRYTWIPPFEDFLSGGKVIHYGSARESWRTDDKSDVITLNLYVLVWQEYDFQRRLSQLKETLAHEVGHILYSRDRGEETRKLRQKFNDSLGKRFETPYHQFGNHRIYYAPTWEYSYKEAFADIARMVLCSSCDKKPETAVEDSHEIRSLVLQIIIIATLNDSNPITKN